MLYKDNFIRNMEKKNPTKIGWKINRQHPFWHLWASCLFHVIQINKRHKLFRGQWTFLSSLILIGPVVSEKKIQSRKHPFWHIWASCFFHVIPKKHELLKESSNVHSYKVWSQLWFQRRRLKTDNTHFDTNGPLVSFVYFWSA
jgi:hypothetical protein